MTIHSIPPSEPDPLRPFDQRKEESEAMQEAWAEALQSDARAQRFLLALKRTQHELDERNQQLTVMRHVANILSATTRTDQLGSLVLDVLLSEFGAHQGLVWSLSENAYEAVCGMAFNRRQLDTLRLPVPHPFPRYPILIYQSQWLELEALPPGLRLIQARPEDGLFFVPFEHQTLLTGFAVLSMPKDPVFSPAQQESLEVLQRLFASALHSAWMLADLQYQKDHLKEKMEAVKTHAEALLHQNQALWQGQTFRLDFLAYAANELRGQLLGILTHLGRIRTENELSERERGEMLLDGLLAGKHMAELLRDLGELANPEKANGLTAPRPVELEGLFKVLRPLVEAFPRREAGAFDWPSVTDLPEVLADREVLLQILLSLCAGALRNSRSGNLRVWIERELMSLTIKLMLEGLDLGDSVHAFNARISHSPEELYVEGHGGTGLGLVICRQLMDAMGGALRLERDAAGAGMVIGLDLPLA